jgi:serine protease Do
MASVQLFRSIHFTLFSFIVFIGLTLFPGGSFAFAFYSSVPEDFVKSGQSLVRVTIITEVQGFEGSIEVNGKLIEDYNPVIIREFSSTGIVIDGGDHVLTFLGYHWVDVWSNDPRVEITTSDGKKWNGSLVGIDQSNGAAVIGLIGGTLRPTPVCHDCELIDGAIVVAPIAMSTGVFQFRKAEVLSVGAGVMEPASMGAGPMSAAAESWSVVINQPFLDAGQPVFSSDYRVLGFISGWDPVDMKAMVYPIARLSESAGKILKAGGDICTGWLGIFLQESDAGILVQGVEPDSPAQKAGLRALDSIRVLNGEKIGDVRRFIHLVQNAPIGSDAGIEIVRQGKPLHLTASVEERRPPQARKRLSFNSPRPLVGLETVALNSHLADALQMPGTTGLFVVNVVSQTPADRAGVLPGDVIVAMDGQPILDAMSFASYWQTHILGSHLILNVLRKGKERVISIPLRNE